MIYNKLICFDFDDTLMDTPKPEDGKGIWEEKMGVEWTGGWWANPKTLDMNVFDIKPNPEVYREYLKAVTDESNYVIMATGRIDTRKKSLKKEVNDILQKYNLSFDGVFLNTGGDTYDFKRNLFEEHINKLKVNEFVMYDDRLAHIIMFKEWAKTMSCDVTIVDVREKEVTKIKNL